MLKVFLQANQISQRELRTVLGLTDGRNPGTAGKAYPYESLPLRERGHVFAKAEMGVRPTCIIPGEC